MATTLAGPAGAAGVLNWETIKNIKAPCGIVPPNQFGYWFNYFWEEARQMAVLTQAQKDAGTAAYLTVFENMAGGTMPRAGFTAKSAAEKQQVLVALLLIGFKRVSMPLPTLTPIVPGELVSPPCMAAKDAAALQLQMVQGKGIHWPIGFRADTRTYQELADTGGFIPRARSHGKDIYRDFGFDQPWHPYNNPVYGNSLWLRLGTGSRDNCLHTVISIGPKFAEITHFPILGDATVFDARNSENLGKPFLIGKAFDLWNDADIATARAHRQRVEAQKVDGTVHHLEKRNHVYVFHLLGIEGVNTEEEFPGPDKFGERGISSVPAANFLAELPFIQRYWFNDTVEEIKLYEIKFDAVKWLPSEAAVDLKIGSDGRLKLLAMINDEIQKAQNRPTVIEQRDSFLAYQARPASQLKAGERTRVVSALKEYYARPRPAAAQTPAVQVAPPKPTPPAPNVLAAAPAGPAGVVKGGGAPPPPPGGLAMKPASQMKTLQQQTAENNAERLAEKNAVKARLAEIGSSLPAEQNLKIAALIAKIDAINNMTWGGLQQDAKK